MYGYDMSRISRRKYIANWRGSTTSFFLPRVNVYIFRILVKKNFIKHTFQLSDVFLYAPGDKLYHGIFQAPLVLLELSLDDRHAHFIFRVANIGDEPALEARTEPFLERGDGARRPVGGDNDLFAVLVKRVESMEKFFLGFFFSSDELDVVDNKHVHVAVTFFNVLHPLVSYRPHDVACEFFRRDISRTDLPLVECFDLIADHLDKMGFPQAHSAIHKEGIIFRARFLHDRGRGSIREVV